MSHSRCTHDPFSCDKSLFFEESNNAEGKAKRWIECAEYCKVKRWGSVNKYFMVEYEVWIANETGKICDKNSADWLDEYARSSKEGYSDMSCPEITP